MIQDRPEGEPVQVLQVGVDDRRGAIKASLDTHPGFDELHIVVDGVIHQTSVAFMELAPGEVRTAAVTHPSVTLN